MARETLDAGAAPGRIAIVGGGTMGVGIVYVFAAAGFKTHLVEPDEARAKNRARDPGRRRGQGRRTRQVRRGPRRSLRRGRRAPRRASRALPEGLDLVIESVPERLETKRAVLAAIAARNPSLIATNTSALSVDALAGSVADASAFLGMHFFNPVWSLPLVELVRGAATSDAALARARALAEATGKTTVTVSDTPGFATSRLDLIAAMEAIRMVEDGVASAEDIDRAMTVAYRHPIGPLRLSDIVGLDVRLDIARNLASSLGPRYAPPALLADMVARGDLGAKSGRGFFEWPHETARVA